MCLENFVFSLMFESIVSEKMMGNLSGIQLDNSINWRFCCTQ